MNAFFNSQFNYCPLVWMFHSRCNNNKINRLHERCLRIIYNDKQSSFEELLEKDGSVSIHIRNLQLLATEMYKVTKGLSPQIMNDVFTYKSQHSYNLRQISQFATPRVNTVYHGTESVGFLGAKIWALLPISLKNIDNINAFKKEIKKWKPKNCPCRLCKVYVQNVGFV